MEINLRREMVKWLTDRGHWVVLRCFQIPRLSGKADVETGQQYKLGHGTPEGKVYKDYLVKSDRRKSVPDYMVDTPIGDANVGVDYYYLEHHIPVKSGDMVLEIELDSSGDPVTPVKIIDAYRVTEAEVMRDGAKITAGRLEFYQCRVEKLSVRP